MNKAMQNKHTGGTCFQDSFRFVMKNTKGADLNRWFLVHGEVWSKFHNKYIVHAWVEINATVVDPAQNIVMSVEKYYGLGKIKNTLRYTPTRMSKMVLKYTHYGPWEE